MDIDVGVSLLNGKVWDKIKSDEASTVNVEQEYFKILVELMDTIQVCGSVTIPVTISGTVFEQTFTIANWISGGT